MKFWKTLRWVLPVLFLALVLLAWLSTDAQPTHGSTDAVRAVPNMVR